MIEKQNIGVNMENQEWEELPVCPNCGKKPKLKQKTVDSCDGWASDRYEWIECECGMRTIERSTAYYRPKVIKSLIAIFSGQNNKTSSED